MDANKIQVVDSEGKEIEFEVLFTFNSEDNEKKYVLYYDPTLEESNVYASVYDEEGNLFEIDDPEEWKMIEEVFHSFMAEQEEHDHEHDCGCGCGEDHHHHHHHGDDECGCGHNHEEESNN